MGSAIERSKELAEGRDMQHIVADLCILPQETFHDASFDLVVDKGALDALLCAGSGAVTAAVGQLWRVLRPEGLLILISGVATQDQVLATFSDWEVILDGSPYITSEGDASIDLHAQ